MFDNQFQRQMMLTKFLTDIIVALGHNHKVSCFQSDLDEDELERDFDRDLSPLSRLS